jgi:hypothetical protein
VIEIAALYRPAKHGAHVLEHTRCFNGGAAIHDGIDHAIDVAPVNLLDRHSTDDRNDVLRQAALDCLNGSQVMDALSDVVRHKIRHSAGAATAMAGIVSFF